ncbi:MAG: ATP-binding cassette domain-containing protein, partial [Clostridia bacterium]|nr:ATP-binding cassette domain-containing protein [Clostridia bacterium]
MSTLLQTVDLKKYFKRPQGNLHAVDGVNVSIEEGETLGVVGESGCGKSTLGNTVLRLHEPTGGQILYKGEDIAKYDKKALKKVRHEMQMIF